jgi:hypothetical protein
MIAQVLALDSCRAVMPRFPFRVEMHLQDNLFSIASDEISRRPSEFALSPILFSAEKICGIAPLSNEGISKDNFRRYSHECSILSLTSRQGGDRPAG